VSDDVTKDARTQGGPATIVQVAEKQGNGIIARRWVGAWIDLIAAASIPLLADQLLGNERYRETLGVWLGLPFLYFIVFERLWGRTLGKVVSGTVVVNAKGGRPSLWQAVLRTLLRIIEVNPILLGGIPAGIVALATPAKQRLGDLAAKTYVVRSRDLRAWVASEAPKP
jgi:uncharacterized RDD family membrane protein YckC